jgi:hypothetical protein
MKYTYKIFAQIRLHFIACRCTLYTDNTDLTDKPGFFNAFP